MAGGGKKIKKTLKISLFLLAIFVLSVFVFEQNVKADDNINELEEKQEKYQEIIDLKEKQKQILNSQLQLTEAEKQQNNVKFRETEKRLADIFEEIDDLYEKIKEKEQEAEDKKKILSNLLRAYYEENGSLLFELTRMGRGVKTFFSQSDYLSQSTLSISEILQEVKDSKKELEEDKGKLEEKRDESEELKEDLKERGYYLQSQANIKQDQINKTQSDIDRYQEKLAKIEAEIYELEVGKTYANLGDLDDFDFPVSPVVISQYYGMTSYAKSGAYGGGPHNGVDFSIAEGNSVRAVADGKILSYGKCYQDGKYYAYGKWVAIEHEGEDADYVTFYAHLNSNDYFKKGAKVKKGDKIGKSGNTGYSTGPHLHFSLFTRSSFRVVESSVVDGLYIPTGTTANPMKYF